MSQTEKRVAREWIIKKDRILVYEDENRRNYEGVQIAEGETVGEKEKVHVIEISAYTELEAKAQELIETLKTLKVQAIVNGQPGHDDVVRRINECVAGWEKLTKGENDIA
jgi:flagellar biogenesis protein FliO